jgi:hypothetical protein
MVNLDVITYMTIIVSMTTLSRLSRLRSGAEQKKEPLAGDEPGQIEKAEPFDSAFLKSTPCAVCLLSLFRPSPVCSQPDQAPAKKEEGGGFRDGIVCYIEGTYIIGPPITIHSAEVKSRCPLGNYDRLNY